MNNIKLIIINVLMLSLVIITAIIAYRLQGIGFAIRSTVLLMLSYIIGWVTKSTFLK